MNTNTAQTSHKDWKSIKDQILAFVRMEDTKEVENLILDLYLLARNERYTSDYEEGFDKGFKSAKDNLQ